MLLIASVTGEETNEHKTANHCDLFSGGEFVNLRLWVRTVVRADTYTYANAYIFSNSNTYADTDAHSDEHADANADRDSDPTAALCRTLRGQAD